MELTKIKYFFEMIKIEHTLFSLPFVYMGAFLAYNTVPSVKTLILITLALFSGRVTAMVANRVIDVEYDKKTPRTMNRHIPAGKISKKAAYSIIAASSLLFFITVYFINVTSFILSFVLVPLFIIYSFMKRFTYLSHFGLGVIEGVVPVGGWIATTGNIHSIFSPVLILIFVSVVLWQAGFDIIYSIQDVETDLKIGVHSIPVRFGITNALIISLITHIFMGIFLTMLLIWIKTAYLAIGIAVIWLLIAYEHSIVNKDHLDRINFAFFHVNITIAFVLFISIIASGL
ncbi:MAG: putative 4-hydroxybenzoate polyprenyltransferase [Candidatus Thermoplasmatota archaeon]|jgi:4-hydroxybenzoate polyprenyltransferase|nr:putative 4-hydroxybenzoate polyprenyltransferase [Candidatus Thermoplasmatota archaeon]MCL5963592.1 putative 4-hydroxybenzoate polyprenyltransferase [Candidatus Thermoplasmatota archaeon]